MTRITTSKRAQGAIDVNPVNSRGNVSSGKVSVRESEGAFDVHRLIACQSYVKRVRLFDGISSIKIVYDIQYTSVSISVVCFSRKSQSRINANSQLLTVDLHGVF